MITEIFEQDDGMYVVRLMKSLSSPLRQSTLERTFDNDTFAHTYACALAEIFEMGKAEARREMRAVLGIRGGTYE